MTNGKLTLTEEQLEDLRKLRERPRKRSRCEAFIKHKINCPDDDDLMDRDWPATPIHGQIDEDVTYVEAVSIEENGEISLFVQHRQTRIVPLSEAILHPKIIAEIHRVIEMATTPTRAQRVTK